MARNAHKRVLGAVAALSVALVAAPATAAAAPAGPGAKAEDFSIVVLPDTQYNSKKYGKNWKATTDWIVDQQDERNIKYTLHVGDIVHNSDDPDQWTLAKKQLNKLAKADAPYILGVGNHDMDNAKKNRKTTKFNKAFPPDEDLPSFGSSYPEGKNDNSYHTFAAGGTNWLILSLKYEPTKKELKWANRVVADHPNHQTMVITHKYMNEKGRGDTGDEIWNKLLKKHANISFVFSGHYKGASNRVAEGEHGNKVYQMHADYQVSDKSKPNSFIRYMKFSPSEKTVKVRTYSPRHDENAKQKKNHFNIKNFEFIPAK